MGRGKVENPSQASSVMPNPKHGKSKSTIKEALALDPGVARQQAVTEKVVATNGCLGAQELLSQQMSTGQAQK